MSNSLEPILIDVISKLKQGRFANEQAISQGIVLRVLQALGWDTFDTSLVSPEFRTAEGRADFALCHPATKPVLYIEVKPPGKAEESVRQALGYGPRSRVARLATLARVLRSRNQTSHRFNPPGRPPPPGTAYLSIRTGLHRRRPRLRWACRSFLEFGPGRSRRSLRSNRWLPGHFHARPPPHPP